MGGGGIRRPVAGGEPKRIPAVKKRCRGRLCSSRRRRRPSGGRCWLERSSLGGAAPQATDEPYLAEQVGATVLFVPARRQTSRSRLRQISRSRAACCSTVETPDVFRIGVGYDSHRTIEGRKLMLGGEHIPSTVGLKGHSDGDALSRDHRRDSRRRRAGRHRTALSRHRPPVSRRGQPRPAPPRRWLVRTPALSSRISTRSSSPSGRSSRRTSIASVRRSRSARRRGRRERERQDERRHGRDRSRRGHGGPRGSATAARVNGKCACASPQAPRDTCMSATRARRCSTGCSRAGSGGTFILRIEDTDRERSTRESERRFSTICAGSAWTGTRGPMSAGLARTASPSGSISTGSTRRGCWRAATPTTASARRSSSRPIGRRRGRCPAAEYLGRCRA